MLLNSKNQFQHLGYMVDCSRGAVPKVSTLKRLIDILKKFGYTYLMLYTEDTYEIEGEPYFGYMRGKYSTSEIKELDQYCIERGIELRPCIQTLAHLGRIKRHTDYASLFDIDDILEVKNDDVYEFIDKMFSAISRSFTSKNIHIGMDEAYNLGKGNFLKKNGLHSKLEIMQYHLKRVAKIAKKYDFNCEIWGDMILESYYQSQDKENFKIELPKNITPVNWRYYILSETESLNELNLFNKITNNNFNFAGGAHKWYGFVPNNQYSLHLLKEEITNCKKVGVKDFLVTGWADGAADASLFSTLPALFYASTLAHNLEIDDTKKSFEEIVGLDFDSYLKIDCLNRLSLKSEDKLINNLSFIYLYNDLFQGIFDDAEFNNANNLINNCSKILNELSDKKFEFNYIFKSLEALANLLFFKVGLGKSIYNHYHKKNFDGLKDDIINVDQSIDALKNFIEKYEIQWHKENKTYGYEKQCIRLGGLLERLKYCKRMLTKLINNEIKVIDELEEKRLPISTEYWNNTLIESNVFNNYEMIVSGGFLKEI